MADQQFVSLPKNHSPAPTDTFTNPTLLLVESPGTESERYRTLAKRAGFKILTANSGPMTRVVSQRSRPDLVLLPPFTGPPGASELARSIKENPKTKDIPVMILVDSDSSDPDMSMVYPTEACASAGASDAYLVKIMRAVRSRRRRKLPAASQGVSIHKIVDSVRGHDGAVLRACYGHVSGGTLEAVEPDKRSRIRRNQEETRTLVVSETLRKVGLPEDHTPSTTSSVDAVEAAPKPTPPRAELTPPSVPPERDETAQDIPEETGFDLRRVYAWAVEPWNALRRWLGRFDKAPEEPAREQPESDGRPPLDPAHPIAIARPARVPETPSAAKAPEIESVGAPSRSMKQDQDESSEPNADAGVDSVGVPSWSLKSDEIEEGATESPIESVAAQPTSEQLEAPSWSIMHLPPEPTEETVALTRSADIAAETDEELPVTMDDELLRFIEGYVTGDDEPSLASQIPVEEIEQDEERLQIEDESEIEIEVEEEAVSELSEPEMVQTAAPSRPVATARPDPKPVTEASADFDLEAMPTKMIHEQEIRRMKQSGGEARVLRDVKLHFGMRDWQGAVPLLEQLVMISPGKALYRGMLGRAVSRHPATRRDAEGHFIEALRLSPRDPELHYWLGLYYKSFGLKSRAISEFRTVLRINPKHEGARKQLPVGDKNLFEKIFG